MRFSTLALLAVAFSQPLVSRAADFEIGPDKAESSDAPARKPASRFGDAPAAPRPIEAGDIPTAYGLLKYETRADVRFYEGGGILGRAWLGLFPRFFIGGGANVRGFIGSSPLSMTRDDAQLLARLIVLEEDEAVPGLALGFDGPSYERGTAKGLYLSGSKEFPTALGFFQAHAGLNSAEVQNFVGDRDLRAFGALTTTFGVVTCFTEVDEVLDKRGSRWNAGLRAWFEPISLGVELRDLGSARANTPVSRLLRVAYVGRF